MIFLFFVTFWIFQKRIFEWSLSSSNVANIRRICTLFVEEFFADEYSLIFRRWKLFEEFYSENAVPRIFEGSFFDGVCLRIILRRIKQNSSNSGKKLFDLHNYSNNSVLVIIRIIRCHYSNKDATLFAKFGGIDE